MEEGGGILKLNTVVSPSPTNMTTLQLNTVLPTELITFMFRDVFSNAISCLGI